MSRLSLNFYRDDHRVLSWLERNILHRRSTSRSGTPSPSSTSWSPKACPGRAFGSCTTAIDAAPPRDGAAAIESAPARRFGIAPDAFVMVAVGNLHTYKGHRDLIEACGLASERLPTPWRVLVAGRDAEGNRALYEQLIVERGLSERITLLGERKDVAQLLFAADLFIHPSHHEGLPNSVIEAMAAGLPVVATAVGGVPETVLSVGTLQTGRPAVPHDPARLAERSWRRQQHQNA